MLNINNKSIVILEKSDLILDEIECPICLETKESKEICYTSCRHCFCVDCIGRLISKNNKCICPMCRTSVKEIYNNDLESSVKIMNLGNL